MFDSISEFPCLSLILPRRSGYRPGVICVLFNTTVYPPLPQITKQKGGLLACGRRVFYSIPQFTLLCLRSHRSSVTYWPVGDMRLTQSQSLPLFASDHPEVKWLAYWPVGDMCFIQYRSLPHFASDHQEVE